MNNHVIEGLKRVQSRLFGFCLIFGFFIALNILCVYLGDKPATPVQAYTQIISFVVCFILHSLVRAFVRGYEGKED